MSGAELCLHNSRVRSWASLDGDERVVIGGYESGVDAAVNLARAGKRATVLASTATILLAMSTSAASPQAMCGAKVATAITHVEFASPRAMCGASGHGNHKR